MINVTKTYLPPLSEYVELLEGIWDRAWVTNNGPLVVELEQRLGEYFGLPMVQFVSNGTIALQIALRALDIRKSVITTPFSYVATTTSLLWEQCKPVFVDIDERTFCIDPQKIEDSIDSDTEAILATHVYGYPCQVDEIQEIANRHGLKVIYDAAHAFGTKLRGKSLLGFGDLSTLSFHATKLFHTIEGGAVVANTDHLCEKIWLLKSFGHKFDDYQIVGINGKNSELHAAMGLCLLPKMGEIIARRKTISELYDGFMNEIGVTLPAKQKELDYNYAYYPIIFEQPESLESVRVALVEAGVHTRRYFFPSLNTLPYCRGTECRVSEYVADRVLCLPLYAELEDEDVLRICNIVAKTLIGKKIRVECDPIIFSGC